MSTRITCFMVPRFSCVRLTTGGYASRRILREIATRNPLCSVDTHHLPFLVIARWEHIGALRFDDTANQLRGIPVAGALVRVSAREMTLGPLLELFAVFEIEVTQVDVVHRDRAAVAVD